MISFEDAQLNQQWGNSHWTKQLEELIDSYIKSYNGDSISVPVDCYPVLVVLEVKKLYEKGGWIVTAVNSSQRYIKTLYFQAPIKN